MTEQKHVWWLLRRATPQVDWMRLENLVGTGAPDVNGCLNGVDVWIENKIVRGNLISLRPTQPAWIVKRLQHGGRVFVFARHNNAFYLWGGRNLVSLLRNVKTRTRTMTVDYRSAEPTLILRKPYAWEELLDVVFERNPLRTQPVSGSDGFVAKAA